MTGKRSLVSIVDDDESVRESLPDLLRLSGFAAEAFSSAEAFLASDVVSETGCLLLTSRCPGCRVPTFKRNWPGGGRRFRLCSSPASSTGPSVRVCSRAGP